ncbi:sarcosine oxidase [Pochonia chlamydosporia 170]|uniref:Sarcosine oxidase n=1 Tax=Pochonia chlamydosporia 170 TaxID=1380566 RepID=A0A179F0K2_METCM|nr:sarcosine oxidase [Pochonia chlamydosporia 170]OAQ58966.1 sarcosine oxidase [Pochonia chlamydosporia 170]
MSSYLIIGAGNFGAATALTLIKREPASKVTLVDCTQFPNPRAASHDVNKIVHDDYPDKLYMQMLKRAMPMWRNHELYKTWYHEVGMLRADPSNFGEEIIASYKDMGIENNSNFISVKDVRERWNGSFATANFAGLEKILFNPKVGFAEADKALEAVIQEAVDQGVEYVLGVVTKINIGAAGECTGVTLQSGETLNADKLLLATGARTAALLAQSAPENQQFHAEDRLLATGALSFYAKVQGAQKERLSSIPVLKNCLPHVKGETISILADGTIKFNCDMYFTNYVECPFTGQRLSMAPDESIYNVWTGPKFMTFFQECARKTLDGLYGKEMEDVIIDAYRICWDASTPTHDFLITPHPHCRGLYVATGGSFHGWKFLPVIGDYIADMMQGSLEAEFADRWAWDQISGDGHSVNPTYDIVGDLQGWLA